MPTDSWAWRNRCCILCLPSSTRLCWNTRISSKCESGATAVWKGRLGSGVLRGASHDGAVERGRRLRVGMECLSTSVTRSRIVLHLGASRCRFGLQRHRHRPLAFHLAQRAAAFMMRRAASPAASSEGMWHVAPLSVTASGARTVDGAV